MPRLNSKGQAVCPGTGLGPVSVDGAVIFSAGSDANWLNDDTVIAQVCGPLGCVLATFDGQDSEAVDPQGANWLRADGDVWAAWLNGTIRTKYGATWTDKYLCDVSRGIVLLTTRALRNIEFWTSMSGTLLYDISTGVLRDDSTTGLWVRWRGRFLLWGERDGSWHAQKDNADPATVPIMPRTEPVYGAVPIDIHDELWLLEHCGAQLTLRPANSTLGYVVASGDIYGIDARFNEPNVLVAWSVDVGQSPHGLRTALIDLRSPRTELNATTPPPDPIPVPPSHEDTMISYSLTNVKDAVKSKPEAYEKGERVPQANGGFAIRKITSDPKTNGYYVTVTPEGDPQQRPEGIATPEELKNYKPAAWETFVSTGNIAKAERERGNNGGKPNEIYWFPCIG